MHIRQITTRIPQSIRFALRRALFVGSDRCEMCQSRIRGHVSHGGGAEVLTRRRVVGGQLRENDRCPVCHAADRTRLMMHYLVTQTELGERPYDVLHVAPDLGLHAWLQRQDAVAYTGTDLDAARYRHIDHFVPGDLTDLPFDDKSFDMVICSHVLEHIPDDRTAIAEILRVLRVGGRAMLLTPYALDGGVTDEDPSVTDPDERHERFGQWDHVRIYALDDLVERIAATGFDVTLYDPFASDAPRAEELHLNPEELLPVGTRPA